MLYPIDAEISRLRDRGSFHISEDNHSRDPIEDTMSHPRDITVSMMIFYATQKSSATGSVHAVIIVVRVAISYGVPGLFLGTAFIPPASRIVINGNGVMNSGMAVRDDETHVSKNLLL